MIVNFTNKFFYSLAPKTACLLIFGLGAFSQAALGQTENIQLNDLSSFRDAGKSWQIAGDVTADLGKENKLETAKGSGVLVNIPSKKNPGIDLFSNFEHGDLDLELDYMMAKGSNSGIYLQGMYELQLRDSWGAEALTPAENGGMYERWDESKPEGQKGYQGNAPRQQVGRAPGLWQHLKLSFQAPRFDEQGNKVENARILRAELNGVVIHEDVELTGPTRGPMRQQEMAQGPLRFQGDHGAVAFRNIKVSKFEKPRPVLKNLRYTVYEGKFEDEASYQELPPEAEGSSVILTSNLSPRSKQFLIRYQGSLQVEEAGEYTFKIDAPGGAGLLRINEQELIPLSERRGEGTVDLPKGEMPFELLYSKYMDWMEPGLGLAISAPDLREYLISEPNSNQRGMPDPILLDASEQSILRSFMDIPEGPRVTHAISVGSKEQLHYTYDLDHGTLVQAWRGDFLDTTPMWHQRGDGSSRPRGSVEHFVSQPELTVAQLASPRANWITDTTGTSYKPKGYKLDKDNQPTFYYQVYNSSVEDAFLVQEDGKRLERRLSFNKPANDVNNDNKLYVRMAQGKTIKEVAKGLYLINDKAYYLRVDEAGKAKPLLRKVADGQELIIPAGEQLIYSILF